MHSFSCLILLPYLAPAWGAPSKRVGILFDENEKHVKPWENELRARLAEFAAGAAYDLKILTAYGNRDRNRISELAHEFARVKVDVILAIGTSVALQAHAAIREQGVADRTALVFIAANPVDLGLVQEISRPGGFATGVGARGLELTPKRLELLAEILHSQSASAEAVLRKARGYATTPVSFASDRPARYSISVLYDTTSPTSKLIVPLLEQTEPKLPSTRLHAEGCETLEHYVAAIQRLAPGTNAFYITGISWRYGERKKISDLLQRLRKPVVFSSGQESDDALFSYTGEADSLIAVEYVHRILSGARPSELPVYMFDRVRFVLNAKAAEALGLRIPHHLKNFADKIVQ